MTPLKRTRAWLAGLGDHPGFFTAGAFGAMNVLACMSSKDPLPWWATVALGLIWYVPVVCTVTPKVELE